MNCLQTGNMSVGGFIKSADMKILKFLNFGVNVCIYKMSFQNVHKIKLQNYDFLGLISLKKETTNNTISKIPSTFSYSLRKIRIL